MKYKKLMALASLVGIGFFIFQMRGPGLKLESGNIQTPAINLARALDVPIRSKNQAPILMYHHVGQVLTQNALSLDLTVSTNNFDEQLAFLKSRGYQSVSMAQLYENLKNGLMLPNKPMVLTFDDGYKDVFENAVPVLEKYDYIGSFAIATELLGRPTYASWDDVFAARRRGMEIISHSENHLDLTSPKYSDEDLKREIFGSKEILEQKLSESIDFFVYPYGKYNAKVIELLQKAGYKLALTTEFGTEIETDSLYTTARVRVHGQNGLEKLKKVLR